MIIGTTEVRTPADYPWAYDPFWRHEMAKARLANPHARVPTRYNDDYVRHQRDYLAKANSEGFELYVSTMLASGEDHPMRDTVLANRLFGSTGYGTNKERVEALLLCPEMTYGHIGKYFGMRDSEVDTYQRLFFNCRDDDGKLVLPHGLMQYFATRNAVAAQSPADYATNWRSYAFQGGSRMLFLEWRWPYDSEHVENFREVELWSDLLPKVYQRLEERLRFDFSMDGRSLADTANLVRQALADLRKEGIVSKEGGQTVSEEMMELLSFTKPTVLLPGEASFDRKQVELDQKKKSMMKDGSVDVTGETSMARISSQLNKQE